MSSITKVIFDDFHLPYICQTMLYDVETRYIDINRNTVFKAIENIIYYVCNLIYFPCSKPTFAFVFGKTLLGTLHLFIIFVDMRKTCFSGVNVCQLTCL